MSNYLDVYVKDALKRVKGVGDVTIFGVGKYAMRIWLDPVKLAARQLTASDVVAALQEQNVEVPSGQLGAPPSDQKQAFQISVNVVGRLSTPEQFNNIVVKNTPAGIVQIKDVGHAELGSETYASTLTFNGIPAVGFGVQQLSNANALQVDRDAKAEMDRLARSFPPGMKYAVAFDTTTIVGASIREVIKTLIEAIIIVILVIFFFLQDWRATLIPAVTIPVSLIGTFAFISLFGFSINSLTLFGITLATGLVVDDAIVVIENVQRHISEGDNEPHHATSAAMGEVTSAVIATSLVLIAVFVPVSFFPGTTGILYRQFSLTIAFSIAISAFNALTLSPALAALLLRREDDKHGPAPCRRTRHQGPGPRLCARHPRRAAHSLGHAAALLRRPLRRVLGIQPRAHRLRAAGGPGLPHDPRSGAAGRFAGLHHPHRSGGQRDPESGQTGFPRLLRRRRFQLLRQRPQLRHDVLRAQPWDQRKGKGHSAAEIVAGLRPKLFMIPGALIIPLEPPAIQGVGTFGGFQFELQDRGSNTLTDLDRTAHKLVAMGSQRKDLTGLFTSFTSNDPQVLVRIDREKAKALGVPFSQISDALQVYMGSEYVNNFDFNNRSYRVYVQAAQQFRENAADIRQYYVRSSTGQMIPLDNLVTIENTSGPQVISHYNLFRSAEIDGSAAPGYSTSEGLAAMEDVANKNMMHGMAYEWTGLSLEEIESAGKAVIIFGLGILVVYLTLAALYESFALPFIILLAVPMAVLGALLAVSLRGYADDIYCQIGLVMLIGLAAKNSILIVEFAEQLRAKGRSLVDAAIEAAELRLRPILMTSFAFILGVIPLAIASGAGAAGRRSVGTTIIGGMLVSTVLNLFFIPVLYVMLQTLLGSFGGKRTSRRPAQSVEASNLYQGTAVGTHQP